MSRPRGMTLDGGSGGATSPEPRRVAVVTGASRGIGREIARGLLERGLEVVVCARRGVDAQSAARQLAIDTGGLTRPHALDVTDAKSVAELARSLLDRGRCDVLVNNAGVALDPWRSVLEVTPEVVRATFEVNLMGALAVSQALVPLMRKNGYGRVVNMSSQLGSLERMNGRTFAYRASKAALNVLTKTLQGELAGENVLVNSACPGWVRTGLGGEEAPRSPAEGAAIALQLATLPDGGPRGGFFEDAGRVPW
jgi:NAD(P)-dependent dehydrogenase (short-subunit alcohol dehydrogenase family)